MTPTKRDPAEAETHKYPARRRPLSLSYCRHFARTLGLEDEEVADLGDGRIVHFGGTSGAAMLRLLGVRHAKLWTASSTDFRQLIRRAPDPRSIEHYVELLPDDEVQRLSRLVPFDRFLPPALAPVGAVLALDCVFWSEWLRSRRMTVRPDLSPLF